MTDSDPYQSFRAELFDAGLLVDTGVDGLYGRSARYESIVAGIDRLVTGSMVDRPVEAVFFPPVMARWVFDKTDYLKSFPDLMGSVHTFRGTDRDHAKLIGLVDDGGDWAAGARPGRGGAVLGHLPSRVPLVLGPSSRRRPALRGQRVLLPL